MTHLVQFYETDEFLAEAVSEFLLEGFERGEPAVVIATPPHRAAFVERLRDTGFDVHAAEAERRLVMLDARETLGRFLDVDRPDGDRFREVIGGVLTSIANQTKAPRIRAYGEMVDLLWQDSKQAAALALENLWNELARSHSFALLCAYAMNTFITNRGAPAVCATHDCIMVPESGNDVRSLVVEISRRMHVEAALRQAEQDARAAKDELQDFLDTAIVPIHVVDKNGVIDWVNDAELELLGYSRDEYVGHSVREFHIDEPVIDDLLARLVAGQAVRDYEVRVRAKDGTIRYLLISSSPHMKRGELDSCRCFSRDVTERKRTERERDRLIEELTRTVRLNEMFASVLAHDLRNPLNTILMAGQMLTGHIEDAAGSRTLQRLQSSGMRMTRMIDQLLDFSRTRSGGIPLESKPTDIGVIVRDVVEELRLANPAAVITIESQGDLRGVWDSNRLAQVVSNLVGNAVQHGAGNEISVRLDGTGEGGVALAVVNAGTISSDLLPILFAPFRGAHQRGAKSQGLGLGLFITDQIVRAHGGSIAVASSDGRAELSISLPRQAIGSAAVTTFDTQPTFEEQKRPVAQLTDQALHTLIKSIRDYAIFMLDPDGYVMSWNTGAQLIKGYTRDEIVGRHFSVFYPRDDVRAGKCERELAVAKQVGEYEEQGWRLRKDGTPFWASVVITAVRDESGDLVGFAKITRDLTKERTAKEIERQHEERFKLMVDGVKEYAIFMVDPDGQITTWNSGAERIKGYRADEIVGKHFSTFYPPNDIRAGKPEHELEIARREGRFEEEGWRIRKDGSQFWANVMITALHDANGKLFGFAKVTRDLTERRKHEDDQLRLMQAREAVRLRDEFLSIASHELKTPLSVLRMQLETLRSRLPDADPSVAARLDRTHRAGQRLTELVEMLLDVSQIAGGRFEVRPEPVDLAALIREVVERLSDGAKSARCSVTLVLDEQVSGMWDRSRIDQLLTNLLANAFKYAAGTPIDVSLSAAESSAVLEVRDRGRGLPEGREEELFGRFERAASMQHYGGLGLGLYVVDQIAKAHGGTATASNIPGGGACFRIELPMRAQLRVVSA